MILIWGLLALVFIIGVFVVGIQSGEYLYPGLITAIVLYYILKWLADTLGCWYWWLCWIPYMKRRLMIRKVKKQLKWLKTNPSTQYPTTEEEVEYLNELLGELRDAQKRLHIWSKTDIFVPSRFRYLCR